MFVDRFILPILESECSFKSFMLFVIPSIKNSFKFGEKAAHFFLSGASDHYQNSKAQVKAKNLLQS